MFPAMFLAVLLAAVTSMLAGCGISNIPTFDKALNEAWNEVQSQYQRRAVLIPELVDTLQPLGEHEPVLLNALNDAGAVVRQTNVSPETLTDPEAFNAVANNQALLTVALQKMLHAAKAYPELRESERYVDIAAELDDIKNRIDVARRDYIQKVERYNRELHSVPGRWWRAFMYPDAQQKKTFDLPTSNVQDNPVPATQ